MNLRLLGYLLLPSRPAALMLIAVLTLGFALCGSAGIFGVPMFLVLASWLCIYGYVLLEHVAHGAREPPVLSIEIQGHARSTTLWEAAVALYDDGAGFMSVLVLLTTLVALVKLAGLAIVITGVGLWAFGAVMLLVAAMASAFDHEHVWASTAVARKARAADLVRRLNDVF